MARAATNNVATAIHTLEQRADVRVVFVDLDVRGSLMGFKVAAAIRDRWPPIQLALSGALTPALDSNFGAGRLQSESVSSGHGRRRDQDFAIQNERFQP